MHERTGHYLTHISIPTTLSAAECTLGGGYTKSDGTKIGFMNPQMGVRAIFYDPEFSQFTPKRLFLSTGIRALDHAVEALYQPYVAEVPWKGLSMWAVGTLFECLPVVAREEEGMKDQDMVTRCMLAAWVSLAFRGGNVRGGMGLSHSLGHALGSPYGIPRRSSTFSFFPRLCRCSRLPALTTPLRKTAKPPA